MNYDTVTTWLINYSTPVFWAIWLTGCIGHMAAWERTWRCGFALVWPIYWPVMLATWPIRKAWGWWRKQPSKFDHLEAIDGVVTIHYGGPVVPTSGAMNLNYTIQYDTHKPVTPQTPYGSKPSGEPEWRRALDELEGTVLTTLASHHERIAALEGAKPQPEAVEWRVFKSAIANLAYVCKDGREVAHRNEYGVWGGVMCGGSHVYDFSLDPIFTELHGPEKDAIVASYLEWKSQ